MIKKTDFIDIFQNNLRIFKHQAKNKAKLKQFKKKKKMLSTDFKFELIKDIYARASNNKLLSLKSLKKSFVEDYKAYKKKLAFNRKKLRKAKFRKLLKKSSKTTKKSLMDIDKIIEDTPKSSPTLKSQQKIQTNQNPTTDPERYSKFEEDELYPNLHDSQSYSSGRTKSRNEIDSEDSKHFSTSSEIDEFSEHEEQHTKTRLKRELYHGLKKENLSMVENRYESFENENTDTDKDIRIIDEEVFSIITNRYKGKRFSELTQVEAESIIFSVKCRKGDVYQATIPELGRQTDKMISYSSRGEVMYGRFVRRRPQSCLFKLENQD